ncbi:piggyBac transposable element-derived protein 4-like, partial [Anneissia japonica]|uniref:piggyBac transposable element-derived protein 4-like n=1 Tax=Anneissia japonica TaxID=1529436 RepID=UPI0014257498
MDAEEALQLIFDDSDSDEEELQREIFQGRHDDDDERERSPSSSEFSERCGPLVHDEDSSIFDIFHHFIDDQLLQLIVDETNRYAERIIAQNAGRLGVMKDWRNTDINEVRAFISILLDLGLDRRGSYELHWSKQWLLNKPGFRSIMSRNRFNLLLRCVHLVDNDAAPARDNPNYDKGFKVRFFMEHLMTNFQSAFYPSRNVSVDESVIAFKGRVSFKTYHPMKPHKRGMTVWTLADSRTGYVYNQNLYIGRGEDGPGATQRTVMKVCEPITGKKHHVYMDNYFSSPALFSSLEGVSLGACGTLRTNRVGVPDVIKQ